MERNEDVVVSVQVEYIDQKEGNSYKFLFLT